MTEPLFIVSREDWSLHRKGYEDQSRHQQRVKDALKRNLSDIVSDESIVLSDGRKQVRVPIKSLDEFRFRYNFSKSKHVGQGDGDSQVGDVLGRDPQPAQQPGKGEGAGDKAGEDLYEAEVDMEELENVLFEDWELPDLRRKEKQIVQTEHTRFTDVRKKGMMSNIDRKRTLLENLKRNATKGVKGFGGITPDDLRFKTWETIQKPESSALIIAMMDTSGSMGSFEKYCARSFFFWMTRFLRRKYEHVQIEFIAHHTEAKIVTEEEFFTKGEFVGVSEGARADRHEVSAVAIQHLPLPFLGRRQPDERQRALREAHQGAAQSLQPVRLRRGESVQPEQHAHVRLSQHERARLYVQHYQGEGRST